MKAFLMKAFLIFLAAANASLTYRDVQRPIRPENVPSAIHDDALIPPKAIPGDSPFEYCEESSDEDLFAIDWVAVTPTPPKM